MAVRDSIRPRLLHLSLIVAGVVALLGAVLVAVVAFTALIYAAIGILAGASIAEIADTLSISGIASSLGLHAWIAGILLFIIQLPYLASYNDWLSRTLYD